MPIEQRVMASPKIGGGKIGAKSAPVEEEFPVIKVKKFGMKQILFIVGPLLLLGIAAGVYFMFFANSGEEKAPEKEPEPVAGAVVQIDAHSLNLADGHYLRLGLALQLTEEAGEEVELDPAPALDAAITLFSGKSVAEVTDPQTREELRAELLELLQEHYGEEIVMGVYFSDFVTQ